MCGRARLATDYSQIRIELDFDADAPAPNFRPRYNIAPTEDLLAGIKDPVTGKRKPVLMRWGLIPEWAKDAKLAYSTFNARADSVADKPAFRGAWKAGRRCLVVADGFYEWRRGDKQPFAVAMAGGALMVMAGLWEEWKSPAGELLRTVTIITTEANAALAPVHDRMPVILAPADFPAWLGEIPAGEAELKALLAPCAPERLVLWPVGKRVGSVKFDDAALLEPVPDPAALPKPAPKQGSLF